MITITIKTDNAAFEGNDKAPEVARILRNLADAIERNDRVADYTLRDDFGNRCGTVTEEDGEEQIAEIGKAAELRAMVERRTGKPLGPLDAANWIRDARALLAEIDGGG